MAKNFLLEDEIVYYNFKGIDIKDFSTVSLLPKYYEKILHYEVFISNVRLIFCMLNSKGVVLNILHHNIDQVSKIELFLDESGHKRVKFVINSKYYNMKVSKKSFDMIKELMNTANIIESSLA